MPKAQVLNQELISEKLLKHLSQSGPLKARELCAFLKISQPTFSRFIKREQSSIVRIGNGRQALYALHRSGAWGKSEIPVVIINESAQQTIAATLHALSPRGFYLESHAEIFSSRIYESLPYFFEDLRPSGFLGRLVPRLHPDLKLPEDISIWTDDHCLLYLTRCGWDLIGNFIIGEKTNDIYLENRMRRLDVIAETDREKCYPQFAELVLSKGIAGSSAAGEQPKFLSILGTKEGLLPVMVKFSPPIADGISQRVADLLICEHIAHEVLRKHGRASSQSCLITGEGRLFLEMERFDRNLSEGRRGIISLRALALGFGCLGSSWSETAESLVRQKGIDQTTCQSIVWLETFGRLIGNADMHSGNISFFCEGERIISLAPTYDMLPMMYAPQQNQLVIRTFDPVPPKFFERSVWNDALLSARDFWSQVQRHSQISKEFKALTSDNESKLSSLFM
ncbi:MAG: type II toxin-antitoxin system HipA family toxin YjjJ [Deltaproteobacteria bacterium]|nr:type II toxin-antitoxin system HipA family toxin YjjJ [Deltaproteobacteria bacterium]